MTDVFISYKREEHDLAQRLEQALSEEGLRVWRDDEILPGDEYRAATMRILKSCRAALVIWSPLSMASSWVLDEASTAKARGVLVPVNFEPIEEYPLGFGQLQSHPLMQWDGKPDHPQFRPVLAAVRRLVDAAAPKKAPSDVAEVELAFWRGVQESSDPTYFEAYLARYPAGMFADLARARIDSLSAPKPKRTARKRAASNEPAGPPPLPPPRPATPRSEMPGHSPMPFFTAPPSPKQQLNNLANPPLSRVEMIFMGAVAFIAPFLLWPLVNVSLHYESAFYGQDIAGLFDLTRMDSVFILGPILFGFAWLYDLIARAAARSPVALLRWLPFALTGGFLFFMLIGGLNIRTDNGHTAHVMFWSIAVWIAVQTTRRVTPWLRARLPILERFASKAPPAA